MQKERIPENVLSPSSSPHEVISNDNSTFYFFVHSFYDPRRSNSSSLFSLFCPSSFSLPSSAAVTLLLLVLFVLILLIIAWQTLQTETMRFFLKFSKLYFKREVEKTRKLITMKEFFFRLSVNNFFYFMWKLCRDLRAIFIYVQQNAVLKTLNLCKSP